MTTPEAAREILAWAACWEALQMLEDEVCCEAHHQIDLDRICRWAEVDKPASTSAIVGV